MNNLSIFALKALREIYVKMFRIPVLTRPICEQNPDVVSKIIYEKLTDDRPCMIARFGAFELSTLVNYLGVKQRNRNLIQYIRGKALPWWWDEKLLNYMQTNAGFFPLTHEKIEQFCELMIEDMTNVDILGSWLNNELYVDANMTCKKVHLRLLEPFWANEPWTKALVGKKILVLHPFAETIRDQYGKKEQLFIQKDILPEFEKLIVIPAVQSIGKANDNYADWFEALESMKHQIDEIDFDVCLIGAGAYGFPLAAHVKRIGKKAVHLGGALQLLFGIKGKRWEDPTYGVKEWGIPYGLYTTLMNDFWTRPSNTEKPGSANKVEGGCYW